MPECCAWSVSVGMALKAGFGVAVDVPGVPAITVPVPNVAVNVNNNGFCVSTKVGVACVGVFVEVIISGVLLGAGEGDGKD